MKKTRIIYILLTAALLMSIPGCQNKAASSSVPATSEIEKAAVNPLTDDMCGGYLDGYSTFNVTSESLTDGIWNDITSIPGSAYAFGEVFLMQGAVDPFSDEQCFVEGRRYWL